MGTGIRRWPLPLVLALGLAAACGPPHTIRARTVDGLEYDAPHVVVGAGTSNAEHKYWPETSAAEQAVYESSTAALIESQGWRPDQIQRTSPATRQYDCHGLTLDDGRTWINNEYAEDIARYYGYKPISECSPSTPQTDDIVVYFGADGRVTHSGKVISVSGGTGGKVKVHSKWGRGPDYEHDAEIVPSTYGSPRYYRRC